ncbi:LOB domain-containing protein 37-like [Telopea speciosissima]|uniref:LOB domain-containing protein 37-like n=1 Tax=Telopea speciosissima TaxID=54955 RepID=UPI001CC4BACB|nr:LOB domain-containing protein 37-like [Telopea speciosissima]XP_043708320.1 LOB domain-containing protein 37-like [Telopea speciosissima]XP_043708321.1 LOB domain-containing protein 37-like [Telopea speciosissima]XP_043708322.1 LOB domain-containing protein 37-like [Telopea speciosissima]
MSCNGCRVLRKGCSESCMLRPCLQWIESPEAQGHATVFVAKFFGRAGLMSFISAVPDNQRPAIFQSLLFEACGRTVNPVNGAVGLLGTGNWQVCQAAVETVLRGGTLRPMADAFLTTTTTTTPESDEASEAEVVCAYARKPKQLLHDPYTRSGVLTTSTKRKNIDDVSLQQSGDLDLTLTAGFHSKRVAAGLGGMSLHHRRQEKRRPATPSMNSEESVTTSFDSRDHHTEGGERKLLNLFV